MINPVIIAYAVGSAGIIIHHLFKDKDAKLKKEFIKDFDMSMDCFLQRNQNKIQQRFEVLDVFRREYGVDAIISLPLGLNYTDFAHLIAGLRSSLGGANIVSHLSPDQTSIFMSVHGIGIPISEKEELKFKWYTIMDSSNKDSKYRNQLGNTFRITEMKENDFGYDMEVETPLAIDKDIIKNTSEYISQNLHADICIERGMITDRALKMQVITKPLTDDYPYQPVKTKSSEFYIGMSKNYKPVCIDFAVHPHCLGGGTSGTGKSVAVITGLTNMMLSGNHKDWDVYYGMLSPKQDLEIFKNTPCCKYYSNTLNDFYKMLLHLEKVIEKRNREFSNCGRYVANIGDWNKCFPKKKMKRILLVGDEISHFKARNNDDSETKATKNAIDTILFNIFSQGRNIGMHCIFTTQRATVYNINPEFKGNMSAIFTFAQTNSASSKVMMDDESATKLRPTREFICDTNERVYGQTLYLPTSKIEELIKPLLLKDDKHLLKFDRKGNVVEYDEKELQEVKNVEKCEEQKPKNDKCKDRNKQHAEKHQNEIAEKLLNTDDSKKKLLDNRPISQKIKN